MQDVIIHLPAWLSTDKHNPQSRLRIVYFITGNPGLISYYDTFLRLLAEGSSRDAVVAGASLGGFEVSKTPQSNATSIAQAFLHPPTFAPPDLYTLQDQIQLCDHRLRALVSHVRTDFFDSSSTKTPPATDVILIGHSVGAHIALELVKLHHERSTNGQQPSFSISATSLLTPTIHNIAHSPSGKIATPLLSTIPFFPLLIQFGASTLTSTLPKSWVRGLVARVTGMRDMQAIDVTTAFLLTPGAVRQALSMAACEMREIGENEWREEVWGGVEGGNGALAWSAPKHFFLFAKNDHWVADVTKNEILKAVTADGRATVVDDEDMGIVHAWCLEQSEVVAKMVNGWIEETISD